MKKCKSNTKQNTKCSRNSWFLGYCKQHFYIVLNKYKFHILGTSTIIGIIGLYAGIYQDLIKPVFQSFQEPHFIYCEADNKIRGVVRGKPKLNKTKDLPINLGIKDKQVTLLINNPIKGKLNCFNPYDELFENYCPFSYTIDEDGYFYFNMIVIDYKSNDIGRIRNNKFVLNQNCNFSWNMDEKGFEVVDSNYNVVFSIDFSIDGEVSIQGLFYDYPKCVIIGRDFIQVAETQEEIAYGQKKLTKMFEYYGTDYFETRQ